MNRRELFAMAAGAAALGSLSPFDPSLTALAADVGADALVTLTRTDGTVLKGKIASYDRDKVTMDVVTKPNEPPVSTDILWNDIKIISNGLTRQKALQKWKGEHYTRLCQTCHGDGQIFCPTCHGTAHDPAASATCPSCKGAARIVCTTTRCDLGTIPCPNPKCLKLTDGGWFKRADGLNWKKFNGKNGSFVGWSEHHVGQVVDKVNGEWKNLGICPVCGGYAIISDPVCRGTGAMPCPTCLKKIDSPPCPARCTAGVVGCPACKGTGLKV